MALIFSFLLFVGIALLISLVGMKLWVRPKEAIERVTGTEATKYEQQMTTHPSLIFLEMMQKLGSKLPASPKDVTAMHKRLIRAGMRGTNTLKILYGAKLFCAIALPLMMSMAVAGSQSDSSNKLIAIIAAAAVGFWGPGRQRSKRMKVFWFFFAKKNPFLPFAFALG